MKEWHEQYTLYSEEIDNQHFHIFELAERVAQAKERCEIFDCAIDLFRHMNVHFKDEEQFMRQVNYPGLDEHATAHFKLLTKLVEISQRLAQSSTHHELHDFMQNIFLEHTLELDMLFGQFLSQQHSNDANHFE